MQGAGGVVWMEEAPTVIAMLSRHRLQVDGCGLCHGVPGSVNCDGGSRGRNGGPQAPPAPALSSARELAILARGQLGLALRV
eukprot:3198229-Rhodomonas_salina.8